MQPRSLFLETSKLNRTPEDALANTRKREKRRLVRRLHVAGIAAARVITVPAAATLAGILYLAMDAVAGN